MPIRTTKTGRLSQLAALGARVASKSVVGVLTARSAIETRIEQAKAIAETLAELKGAAMKFGQLLSIQGEHFLPKEVTAALQKLQNAAPAFSGEEMRRIATEELGAEKMAGIEFDPKPLAAASIGQVHRARLPDGREAVMKIQYPGVDLAIDAEVQVLKKIMTVFARFYVDRLDVEPIVEEVRTILRQELDYTQEASFMVRFQESFCQESGDPRFVVPTFYPEYSTRRVLTMSYEKALSLEAFLETKPSQATRNQIGRDLIEHYLREVYEIRTVQTDPNFANYLFRPLAGGPGAASSKVQIVLLDFGACKAYTKEWVEKYRQFVVALDRGKDARMLEIAAELGFLKPGESKETRELFTKMCRMNLEPADADAEFDFGKSDLPKRMQETAFEFIRTVKKTSPPKDVLFLNRKAGGLYFLLGKLGVRGGFRDLFDRYIMS